jgi:hypothetical protein
MLVGVLSPMIEGPRGLLIAIVPVGTPGWLAAIILLRCGKGRVQPFLSL